MTVKISSQGRRDQLMRIVFDWHNTGANQFKRGYNTEAAVCKLCKAPLEDQYHILMGCTHPRCITIREYHLHNIELSIATAERDPTVATLCIRTYHTEALKLQHYPLLLGRIHTQQQTALQALEPFSSIPIESVGTVYKQLVEHCRLYAAMVIHLYSERGNLLDELQHDENSRTLRKKRYKRHAKSTIQEYNEFREAVLGVEQHDTVHSDGTLVKDKHYCPDTIKLAKERGLLDQNCIYCDHILCDTA